MCRKMAKLTLVVPWCNFWALGVKILLVVVFRRFCGGTRIEWKRCYFDPVVVLQKSYMKTILVFRHHSTPPQQLLHFFSTTMSATSKAAVFRALARTRRSSRRFQTKRKIPDETLQDILQSTLRYVV